MRRARRRTRSITKNGSRLDGNLVRTESVGNELSTRVGYVFEHRHTGGKGNTWRCQNDMTYRAEKTLGIVCRVQKRRRCSDRITGGCQFLKHCMRRSM